LLFNHRPIAPCGLNGGAPSAVGRNWVERNTDEIESIGDVICIETLDGTKLGVFEREVDRLN
jgi:N-methylhydantoinase B/oxoprolinase/acetone carboxylase alpha subunit